jgi:hypothetical protein
MHVLRFIFALGILFSTCACTLRRLDVQTQYLGQESLASYHVNTPDPHLNNPIIGQRLLIQWCLPSQDFEGQTVFIDLIVRFRNHEQKEIKIPLKSKRGYYLYDLTAQEYCESGGLLTYKVEIRNDSCIIASWKHPLWANLITFDFKK